MMTSSLSSPSPSTSFDYSARASWRYVWSEGLSRLSSSTLAACLLVVIFFCTLYALAACRFVAALRRRLSRRLTIGIFHPYCDGGGGGERVLWKAVQCLQELKRQNQDMSPYQLRIVIYTGDRVDGADIIGRAEKRFKLSGLGDGTVEFRHMRMRTLVEAWLYPRFTMIGQSVGSIILAFEAMWRCPPDIFMDTTGYAFTYPIAGLVFGAEVACYTHYPTISEDMLGVVRDDRSTHNNVATGGGWLRDVKLYYYHMFAWLYACVGQHAALVMVNSSWTHGHITVLWRRPRQTFIVYPPCDVQTLSALPFAHRADDNDDHDDGELLCGRRKWVVSVGQFRPEKNHELQLQAFAAYTHTDGADSDMRLIMIGGCRDKGDERRVEALKACAVELGVASRVRFEVNVDYDRLVYYLQRALIGIHTMWNEHFGIGVVEYMAAGVLTIAHDSGGPKGDIVVPWNGAATGFLATTAADYAAHIRTVQSWCQDEKLTERVQKMRTHARQRVREFDDAAFDKKFTTLFRSLLRRRLRS